ncbi:MAG: hypothetical protein NHB15_01585 [Methanosarcina barkeri]|nr:hypothetical protein [Methanosarcina sp. ERenArc_MAG2]
MPEIRKHYFLSEYCIIAEERAKRPSDFAGAAEDSGKSGSENCIFCRGAEDKTPLLLQYIKIGKSLSTLPKKGYATGISAAFRTFTLPSHLFRTLQNLRKLACIRNQGTAFMKLS